MLDELYQEVILDHGRKPRNFGSVDGATHFAEGFNTLCGDRVLVSLSMDGDMIGEIKFAGCGCAICMASASLMTQMVKGKSPAEVAELFGDFQGVVTGQAVGRDLGELEALAGVKNYPNRVKCATLAWHAVIDAMKNPREDNEDA
jgi:nitrogen fixation NifU-like protein